MSLLSKLMSSMRLSGGDEEDDYYLDDDDSFEEESSRKGFFSRRTDDDEYDDDDEDEDEDEEDEDEDEDDDEEEEEEEEVRPRRKSMSDNLRAVSNAGSVKVAREKEKSSILVKNVEYIPEEEPFEPGKPVVSKPQSKRKAKNFLIDDDEFEFEFLNMDDRK